MGRLGREGRVEVVLVASWWVSVWFWLAFGGSWLALARLEAKVGNVVRARDVFHQATTKCPDNVHILHAWGHLEQKHGNEALARQCWSRAVEIGPYNPYVCHALSNLEKRQRNYERAKSA